MNDFFVIETNSPLILVNEFPFDADQWPCNWIWHPGQLETLELAQFSLVFNSKKLKLPVKIHVTADHRYKLYLDGKLIGTGPQPGDCNNWFVDSYDLTKYIKNQQQVLTAFVWHYRDHPPYTQIGFRPGFLLSAESPNDVILSSGKNWYCRKLHAKQATEPNKHAIHVCSSLHLSGFTETDLVPDVHNIEKKFVRAKIISGPVGDARESHKEKCQPWNLKPRTINALESHTINIGRCRRIDFFKNPNSLPTEYVFEQFDKLVNSEVNKVIIPPQTNFTVLLDRKTLTNGYPILIVSKGENTTISLTYQEGLQSDNDKVDSKGHRDSIKNRSIAGITDYFYCNGRDNLIFEPLCWRSWRYIQANISTANSPLILKRISARYTGYPFELAAKIKADKPFSLIVNTCLRTLRLCSNETYMDCPYYEQLQYIGDTRIQALISYLITGDDSLAKQAMVMLNESRLPSGFTQSRYPSRIQQIITPFSLFFISMIYDFLMWRNSLKFVSDTVLAIKSILNSFENYRRSDGILDKLPYWQFVDWTNHAGWMHGTPPLSEKHPSYLINFIYLYVLQQASEILKATNFTIEAMNLKATADDLKKVLQEKAYNSRYGLFSDTANHQYYSQHSIIFAILTNSCEGLVNTESLLKKIIESNNIAKTSYYFRFYLFEAMYHAGRGDLVWSRFSDWQEMIDLGLSTVSETPEPSRSDCHAWSAHPLFHFFASILGIRPIEPLFKKIAISPAITKPDFPCSFPKSIGGTCMTPYGPLEVQLIDSNGNWDVNVNCPEKVSFSIVNNQTDESRNLSVI